MTKATHFLPLRFLSWSPGYIHSVPGQDAGPVSLPSDFILLLPGCPAPGEFVKCGVCVLRLPRPPQSADRASGICGSVLQTSLSCDKGRCAPLNGEPVILHCHWAAGKARPPLRLRARHSATDGGGVAHAGPGEADLVPLRSGHRGVRLTEAPAAALGERRCVISPTRLNVHHEMVLKSRGLGGGQLVCSARLPPWLMTIRWHFITQRCQIGGF